MQKALFVTELDKPVTLGTRAIPEPGSGEVLIKVTATMSPYLPFQPDLSDTGISSSPRYLRPRLRALH